MDAYERLEAEMWDAADALEAGVSHAQRLGLDDASYDRIACHPDGARYVARMPVTGPQKPSPIEVRGRRQAEVFNAACDALRGCLMLWGLSEDEARYMLADSYRGD